MARFDGGTSIWTCPRSPTATPCRPARRSPRTCFPASPPACPPAWCWSGCASWRTRRSMPTVPDSPDLSQPSKRGGRMSEDAAVEEVPVWLEVNGRRWSPGCARPTCWRSWPSAGCTARATSIPSTRCTSVPARPTSASGPRCRRSGCARCRAEGRRPVLASGCGAVSTFLADPATIEAQPARGVAPGGGGAARLCSRHCSPGGSDTRTPAGFTPPRWSTRRHRQLICPRRGHRAAQRGGQGAGRRATGPPPVKAWGYW